MTHGHCHPDIVSAIQEQAGKLNQIIFAGYTHEPAEELAAQLLQFTPPALEYVFFSDSGSTSVEVALKMALGYWNNIGKQRTRIVVMQHSYHGYTVGAMSIGAVGCSMQPMSLFYLTSHQSRSRQQVASGTRSVRYIQCVVRRCRRP
ncbi:aminotransferase class III-fold pyridoxal phosphate-dependent enzyme [Bradyrhizobium sp. CCBAU 21362]|uniref:aminotransferase class III-fold pyridoxal phosphate-dependent enzyme n=1 Tax=Bradyrhizobium sp. CCBAU 21362 TaxID=1325082 RepID=UPI003FA42B78